MSTLNHTTSAAHACEPQLKARYLLLGIFTGLLALALVIVYMPHVLSFTYAQSDNRVYNYLYSQAKSRSVVLNLSLIHI